MNRAAAARALAPERPKCFTSRGQWIVYLEEAAALQRPKHSGPLVIEDGVPRLNRDFNFCRDCTPEHKAAMQRARRCNPGHLLDVIPEVPEKEPLDAA